MSFIKVKNKIIELIESVSPVNNLEFGDSFVFQNFDSDNLADVQSRSFNYEIDSAATDGINCTRERFWVGFTVVVFYREEVDNDQAYEAILTDYELISSRLLAVSDWDSANSGIFIIDDESQYILNSNIDFNEEYGATLTLEFKVGYDKK